MTCAAVVLTFIGIVIQWIAGMAMKIAVGWWLHWIQNMILKSVDVSDFRVSRVSGIQPPQLSLSFRIHNGSASTVTLKAVALYLYGSGAPVGSLVSPVENCPFISTDSCKIPHGGNATVSVIIIPDFAFWLESSAPTGYQLRSSSVMMHSAWGTVEESLAPDRIESDMGNYEQVRDYVRSKANLVKSW
jgi:hypothetical protein